jgi:hypothetical protein
MTESNQNTLIKVAGGLVAAGLGYNYIFKPLLASLGVVKSTEDKKNDAWALSDVFDIAYYKNLPAKAYLMKMAEVNDLIKRLWDATNTYQWYTFFTGITDDDETAIYSALRQPRYKSQVAQLNYYFLNAHGVTLIDYLKKWLNESELAQCREIIEAKKRGF